MFTLEIRGVAVATTDADEAQAAEIFGSDEFKEDIASFTVNGTPLWDGKSELVVRAASEEEIELFSDTLDGDDDIDFDDEDMDEEGASIMFLIEIDQLSDDPEA